MSIILLIVVFLACLGQGKLVALKQWNAGAAHTDLTISVNIYNDNTKFVSGSNDMTVKVWSMKTYSLLHTETFAHIITHISLHPVDNRIFVLVFDGTIKVLDPNTYTTLHATTYPGTGNGNFLRFFASNSKYVISGYDTTNPVFHIYNAVTYAAIAGGAITTFASGDQTTVFSVCSDQTLLAAISNANSAVGPLQIPILIYNINTNTLIKTFIDNTQLLFWILFHPTSDQFYVTSKDMTLKSYKKNPTNSQYDIRYSYSTYDFGYPYCINANINNTLILTANTSIIFLNTSKNYPELIESSADQADVFIIDVSLDGKFIVSGMRNGQITLWQIGETQPVKTPKDQDFMLLIYFGAGIGGFILFVIIAVVIFKCCCNKTNAKVSIQNKNLNNTKKNRPEKDNTIEDIQYADRSIQLG